MGSESEQSGCSRGSQPESSRDTLSAKEPRGLGGKRPLAAVDAPAEAVEGAEGDVLLVGRAPGHRPELRPGQADEPVEVALPEALGRGIAAGLRVANPAGDRTLALGSQGMASQLRTDRQGAPLFAVDWSSVRPPPREGGIQASLRGWHTLPRFCRVMSRAADFFGVKG